MGYVFDAEDADQYDQRFETLRFQHGRALQVRLILDLLSPCKGQRILDVGCGTGTSLLPLMGKGLNLTGVDPSRPMLARAEQRLGHGVDLHKAWAEDLPFDDNDFDAVLFFSSLEFTDRPAKAIEEACRVAKDRVVIGVLNRFAPLNMARRLKSFFSPTLYTHAHFFGIRELRQILISILGHVPVKWRTTQLFPLFSGPAVTWVEQRSLAQRFPWGAFIVMQIKPVPKFRTRPLALKLPKTTLYKPAAGLVSQVRAKE
jgi:ubiquinone/menaquinone biosynthesis C-methylase UbiE